MLIDESQDFPESFFELCSMVTKTEVYIAGDIFQSIFDDKITNSIFPDYLLSKCYRTDPRTLMFAHSLGMGLFENKKLRWLEDKEWAACGYLIQKNSDNSAYMLKREPLRRFEDIDNTQIPSVEIVKISDDFYKNSITQIVRILRKIKDENPTVTVDDVGIIIMDRNEKTYLLADELELIVPREIGWQINKAHESKRKLKGALFVSNRNNVKGLEFPFVICVTRKIFDTYTYRNALYMTLTRSFLQTYVLMSDSQNADILPSIEAGLKHINDDGYIIAQVPSESEKLVIQTSIKHSESSMSFYDFTIKIFDEIDVLPIFRETLLDAIKKIVGEDFDSDNIREIAKFLYKKMLEAK